MMSGVTDVNWPPEPPANISAKAQREWRDVTSNLFADAMPRECLPLLAVWCCLKVELDDVMLTLAQFASVPKGSDELKSYKALIGMRTALTRQFGQLSSKLRLTPQQRLDAHRTLRDGEIKPWSTKSTSASEQAAAPQQRAPRGNGTPWSATGGIESENEDQQ
jgi:hypothetical protein